MKLSDFHYIYPEKAVAIRPPKVRGNSKLFVVYTQTGVIDVLKYKDLPKVLAKDDILVRNDTKVINSRLYTNMILLGDNEVEKHLEVFILSSGGIDFQEYIKNQFDVHSQSFLLPTLVRAKQNVKANMTWMFFSDKWKGRLISKENQSYIELFPPKSLKKERSAQYLIDYLTKHGGTPIPPYLKRDDDDSDKIRYQTIFGSRLGSAAAPTASLNFTEDSEQKLRKKGVTIANVTLHVGLGTFAPLREDDVTKNELHNEVYEVPETTRELCREAKNTGKKIIAMGTTAMRALESYAKSPQSQESTTNLFIYHPYEFQIVTGLLTNFHVPQSSLIVLVDAFLRYKKSKLSWKEIYEFAINNDAKLFSYGDSMLII
jgi:S-adenosylmethionine:tRNA ribosyltransferase-isomerase